MLLRIVVSLGLLACGARASDWETWEDCRLVTSEYFDGDSFHVAKGGKDRIFRLYAVDTAETSDEYPDRVKEQQKYFRASKEEIFSAAKQAEKFTAQLLQKPFTVETCWIDAKGSSHQQRFFGKITLSDGTDLGLRLVEVGLARSYGMREGLSLSYLGKLARAETAAKSARLGVWGGKKAELPAEEGPEEEEPVVERDNDPIDSRPIFDALKQEAKTGTP